MKKRAKKKPDILVLRTKVKWTDVELQEIMSILKPIGTVDKVRASGGRGGELEVVLSFIGVEIATGFFREVGKNLASLSGELIKFLMKQVRPKEGKEARKPSTNEHASLSFYYEEPAFGLEVDMRCKYNSEKQLAQFFQEVGRVHSKIRSAISKRQFPFNLPCQYKVDASMNFSRYSTSWRITVHRSLSDPHLGPRNQTLISQSFVCEGIPSPKKWKYLHTLEFANR